MSNKGILVRFFNRFLGISLITIAIPVQATLITLDGNDIRRTGLYQEAGYLIEADTGLVNGGNLPITKALEAIGFSGDFMETWNTIAVFTLTKLDKGSFDFLGLDVGGYHGLDAAWTFTGFRDGKEIFSSIDTRYSGKLFFNWNGLTSLTIQSSKGSAASSFDNINVISAPAMLSISTLTAPVQANEPPSVVMFVFIALALLRYRLKTAHNSL